jgi:DNA-binding NtrC family response regulator
MSAAQPRRSPSDAAKPATMWVVNSDAKVRQLVDNAVQKYPLHLSLCVIFSEEFRPAVTAPQPEVVLNNLTVPTESCFSFLPRIRRQWPDANVIFLSQSDEMHLWTEAIQLGACDFLPRSVECDQLAWVLQGARWTSRSTICKPPAPSVQPMLFTNEAFYEGTAEAEP